MVPRSLPPHPLSPYTTVSSPEVGIAGNCGFPAIQIREGGVAELPRVSLRCASSSLQSHIVRNALRETARSEFLDWSLDSGNFEDFTIFTAFNFSIVVFVAFVVVVEDDVHAETLKKGANNEM